MALLSDEEIGQALDGLAGWEHRGGEIVRDVALASFRDAVAFVVRISYEAERAGHHPDIDVRYNRVRLALSTHDEGGVTRRDLDLAGAIQALAP